MAKKLNGNAKWIGLAIFLIGAVYAFGRKTTALEKDDEAAMTAISVVKEDVKEIKADVKILLRRGDAD